MQLLYVKPELKDLSQCSRIAFVRAFRRLTQDYVYDYLGLTGDGKIKIRNPCKKNKMWKIW